MTLDWKKSQLFTRDSNIYTFSRNPLLRRRQFVHAYIPWQNSTNDELMFKIKKGIKENGKTIIPFMDIQTKKIKYSQEEIDRMKTQVRNNEETHLIMTNFDSIHVYRIIDIVEGKVPHRYRACLNKEIFSKDDSYNLWFVIDDLFVLEANHIGNPEEILNQLSDFIINEQTQNIFKACLKLEESNSSPQEVVEFKSRWVDSDRSLTYDYYIRSCELKDNIYQDSWDFLSRRGQHQLISCELKRHECVFHRGKEKWVTLNSSFEFYRQALLTELNEVYILPLVNAIAEYECLKAAWMDTQEGLINPRMSGIVREILLGNKTQLDSLEDFIFYVQNSKSFLFSLKNRFTKKIHKEEFLLVESFLNRQESLIDSLVHRNFLAKITSIIEIHNWIERTNSILKDLSHEQVKDCNLKLSHLLTILASASYQDNLFFKLIEEKAAKGSVQKSFEDEVKSLLNIDLQRKVA